MSTPPSPHTRVRKAERFATLPPEWPDIHTTLHTAVKESGETIVVLDDDPTGTQTTHGVHVLTRWTTESLRAELESDRPVFYLLTNTRSMPLAEAQAINAEVARNLALAARTAGRRFALVSRGDSTLRGHFPGEVEALVEGLGQRPDACIFIPFFLEGERYTIDDIHYAADGEWLVPVGETAFARDSAFGYQSSNLRQWAEEKTEGRMRAEDVLSISLGDLRKHGPSLVREKLSTLSGGGLCLVNAVSMRDLEVFTLGLLEAEQLGKRFIYRTAASFIPVRAGIPQRPPLTQEELVTPSPTGGLIVVGSHVPVTTAQVAELLKETPAHPIEIDVETILDEKKRAKEIEYVAQVASELLVRGEEVVIFTSRQLVKTGSADSDLRLGQRISDALVETVRAITVCPRYLLAKGGLTSSDIATKALNVKRALAKGQILPGVPVWELGAESRYPGLSYIIFPGNVGDWHALVEAFKKLQQPDTKGASK